MRFQGAAIAALGLAASTTALEIRGTEPFGDDGAFVFLGKFCLGDAENGATVGSLKGTIEADPNSQHTLYFFDDQPDSWPAVLEEGVGCRHATGMQGEKVPYKLALPLGATAGEVAVDETFTEAIRPRFWFLAVARQGCDDDVKIKNVKLTWLSQGSQLGWDEDHLPGIHTTFVFLNLLVLALHLYLNYSGHTCSNGFRSREKFAPIPMRYVTASLVLRWLSACFFAGSWNKQADDGIGDATAKGMGAICSVGAEFLLWVSAMCVASGYGVTTLSVVDIVGTGEAKRTRSWSTGANGDGVACGYMRPCINRFGAGITGVVSLGLLAVLYIILWIWHEDDRAPWSTEFAYDSGWGVLLVTTALLMGAWFGRRMYVTIHSPSVAAVPERQKWFKHAAWLYTPSFLLLFTVMIIGAAAPTYDRLNAVSMLSNLINLFLACGLVFLYWPSETKMRRVFVGGKGYGDGDGSGGLLDGSYALAGDGGDMGLPGGVVPHGLTLAEPAAPVHDPIIPGRVTTTTTETTGSAPALFSGTAVSEAMEEAEAPPAVEGENDEAEGERKMSGTSDVDVEVDLLG